MREQQEKCSKFPATERNKAIHGLPVSVEKRSIPSNECTGLSCTFGNGYTSIERVIAMTALRCAEVTLAHGYRYFVGTSVADLSRQASLTTPGYAHTYSSASAFGDFATGTATTTFSPPQTFNIYRPALMVSIKMSNNERSLEPLGTLINGQKARPKDAAFLSRSLRQFLRLTT